MERGFGASLPSKKRKADLLKSDSDSELDNPIETWPRFLIISPTDPLQPISKNPFLLQKAMQGLAGEPATMKRLQSGDILVEMTKKSHTDLLLRSTSLAGTPINVTPHKHLNTSRGIVRDPHGDMSVCTEEEILEGLEEQGVTHVRRLTIFREGTRKPSRTYIMTFNTPVLPSAIKVGYMRLKVDTYIPNPLRCFKCQEYGHHKDRCRKSARCAQCSGNDHNDQNCSNSPHCANCGGSHAASDRQCPRWIREKKVQEIKYKNNISFPEARKMVQESENVQRLNYAAAVRQTTSIQTQTDITWPNSDKNFSYVCHDSASENQRKNKSTTSETQTIPTSLQSAKPQPSPKPSVAKKPVNTQPSQSKSNTNVQHKTMQKPEPPTPSEARPDASTKSLKGTVRRPPKGSDDFIQEYNFFGPLDEDMDIDKDDPRKPRPRSPVKPPK